jgi:alpha-ribazole phosphatase
MTLQVWRHPRPHAAAIAGRCVGQTDVTVPARRAKRLARRLQSAQRRSAGVRVVVTSDLQRAAAVGRWLRRWGWRHVVDRQLREADFGHWDGRLWADIAKADVDAWVADFAHAAPGGGESLAQLMQRAAAWQPPVAGAAVVGHAGWMLARRWAQQHPSTWPRADQWPAAPRYGQAWTL